VATATLKGVSSTDQQSLEKFQQQDKKQSNK
jgi:hypothetical protein